MGDLKKEQEQVDKETAAMEQAHTELEKTLDKEQGAFDRQHAYQPRIVKHLPAVLHTFPTLRKGQQQLRVRILQYPKSPRLLDIREFVTSEQFNGFSKKGITIDLAQVKSLEASLPLIIKALEGTEDL